MLALAVLLMAGCYSRLTGNTGRFTFGYLTDVELENFNKPLAPGSRLDLVAFENGTDDETLPIISARSDKPAVLTVVSTNEHHTTIEALAPGHTRITVRARQPDGSIVEDSVFMHVAAAEHMQLEHTCTDTPKAAYLAGRTLAVPFQRTSGEGRAVVGYDYLPVSVEPAGALELLGRPRRFSEFVFRAGPAADPIRIRSQVDATTILLRTVRRSDVDRIMPSPATQKARTVAGRKIAVRFTPMAGRDPVCQADLLTKARSLTPEVCHVSADLDENGSNWNRRQLAIVEGREFGICRYEIVFPEAAGGDGLRGVFKLPVGAFPGDDDGASKRTSRQTGEGRMPWYVPALLALLAPLSTLPIVLWWRRRH